MSGFHLALLAECFFVLATALIPLRTNNTRGEQDSAVEAGPVDTVASPVLEPAGLG
jgi:hypothetical protein